MTRSDLTIGQTLPHNRLIQKITKAEKKEKKLIHNSASRKAFRFPKFIDFVSLIKLAVEKLAAGTPVVLMVARWLRLTHLI